MVVRIEVQDRESLVDASLRTPEQILVSVASSGIDQLDLDDVRSRLHREHPAVLAVPPADLSRISSPSTETH